MYAEARDGCSKRFFFSIVGIVFLENIADGREGCQTIVIRINFFFVFLCMLTIFNNSAFLTRE